MKNKLFASLVTLGLISILAGCSKMPKTEIDAAKTAVAQAKASGADMYLPTDFAAVQDSLNMIIEKIEKQKSRLFHNFGDAKIQLDSLTVMAKRVQDNTEIRKNQVKQEIQVTLTDVKLLLEENKMLLSKAPKGKEGTAALMAIKADISTLESAVTEANGMLSKGDYLTTLDKVKATKDKATSINQELKDAIAKYSKNRPKKG